LFLIELLSIQGHVFAIQRANIVYAYYMTRQNENKNNIYL